MIKSKHKFKVKVDKILLFIKLNTYTYKFRLESV